MPHATFTHRSPLPFSAETVFQWHERPGALERLSPPWQSVELVERVGSIHDGDRTTLRLRLGPLRKTWVAEHRDYQPGRQFCDVQIRGPFRHWVHTHRMEPVSESTCSLEDSIEYTPPGGALGGLIAGESLERTLRRVFAYRHRVTSGDLASHSRWADRPPQRILLGGSSGLVGNALRPFLQGAGHDVVRLLRTRAACPDERRWNPAIGLLDLDQLAGFDTVIHLAGESIASGRWTTARKSRILRSRVDGTRLLAERLAQLERPPRTLLVASAIGFYGDGHDTLLDEKSASGQGFLADVCRQWEAAAEPAVAAGVRVVHLRFGVVLSPAGGALAKMLTPFRYGLGGRLGSGTQWMSWIALDDALAAIEHALQDESLVDGVNVVSPEPVTNADFTRTLGETLNRPTWFPVPAAVLRLGLGSMADELLLASQRVVPRRLLDAGHTFQYPWLDMALAHMLGQSPNAP